MLKKCVKLVLPIFLALFFLLGCWDSRDLEDRDILGSVLVDKTQDGFAFYVRVAAVSAAKSGQSNVSSGQTEASSFKTFHSEGKTIIETREDLDRQADQPVFLGAVQAVILTEKMAKYGIEEYLLRLRQTPDYRKTVDVVVTKEEPEKLMDFQPQNQPSIGFAIESTIQNLVDSGETFHITLARILGVLASPNKCYVLHTIGFKSDVALTGYSVFDGGKYIGFVPVEKSKGIVYFKTNDVRFQYQVPYDNGSVAVQIINANHRIKPDYSNNKVSFDIEFNIKSQVLYPDKSVKISVDKKKEIISNLQNTILEEIADTIRTSQAYACDYLSLYTDFRIAYHEEAKTIDWKKEYPKAEFKIQVKADLDVTSTIHYEED